MQDAVFRRNIRCWPPGVLTKGKGGGNTFCYAPRREAQHAGLISDLLGKERKKKENYYFENQRKIQIRGRIEDYPTSPLTVRSISNKTTYIPSGIRRSRKRL